MNIKLGRLSLNVADLEADFQSLAAQMALGGYKVVSTFTAPDAAGKPGVVIVFQK